MRFASISTDDIPFLFCENTKYIPKNGRKEAKRL